MIPFYEQKGYGILAPDMLGYGGTDKPTDAEAYAYKLVAKDVIDLIDAEGIERVILISHDWFVLFVHVFLSSIMADSHIVLKGFPHQLSYSRFQRSPHSRFGVFRALICSSIQKEKSRSEYESHGIDVWLCSVWVSGVPLEKWSSQDS